MMIKGKEKANLKKYQGVERTWGNMVSGKKEVAKVKRLAATRFDQVTSGL